MARGRLIAFEGGEASGKSTQAAALASAIGALLTREPGGTPIGERIRELVLDPAPLAPRHSSVSTVASSGAGDPAPLAPRTEALLMAADRAQHVAEVVEPALAGGLWVVTDRFTGSSLAYQGYGRGLGAAEVERLSQWAAGGLRADLNILLDVPPGVAAARRGGEAADRMEAEGADFHAQVAEGYGALAAADPEHWVVVAGDAEVEEVAAVVLAEVRERLGVLPSRPNTSGQ